jgi:site-specific recombinase XerD
MIEEHIDHMRRSGRAENTMKRRRMVLTYLAEFLGRDPGDATYEDLDRWQASMPRLTEVRWKTAMIRPYYAYLHARGYRPDNPATLLPRPRAKFKVRTPISDADLFAAVLAAPMPKLAMLLFGGWSGMRAVEIAGLHREHIHSLPAADGSEQWWATVTGKGGDQRAVPIPGWVWDRLEPLLPASGPLFVKTGRGASVAGAQMGAQNITSHVGTFLARAGIDDRLHSLRHRVATAAWRETGDVRVVQQLLGHVNLATLHVYTHVHDDAVAAVVSAIPRPAWPDDPGPDGGPAAAALPTASAA